ncbi:G5 domain-containing protein, partial [Dolosigranulum pigrum]|uniref:G5 domain-containing protein n=1 Tax=Dolosigranulum pigrum TaxID=29394 RepID=UPI001C65DA03
MVGKNNHKVRAEQGANKFKRYTLKKLSIGVASVSIGVGLMFNGAEVASAEEAGQDVAGGSVEEVVEDSEAPFSSEVGTLNEEIEETVVEDDRSVEEVNDSEPTDVLQNGGDDAEVDSGRTSEIDDVAKDEVEQEATVSEDQATVSPIDNEEHGQSNRVSPADTQSTHPEITPQTPTTQYRLDDVRHFFNAEEIKRIEAGQLTVEQALQNALSIQSDVQENKDYHEENVLAAGTRRSTNIEDRSTSGRRVTRAVDAPYYMPTFTTSNTAKDVLDEVDKFVAQNKLTKGEHYLFRYEVARRVSDRRFNKGRGYIQRANRIADQTDNGGNAFNRPLSSDTVTVTRGTNQRELDFINQLANIMNTYLGSRNETRRTEFYPTTSGSSTGTRMGELSNIRINASDRTVTANITIGRDRNNDEAAYIGHQVRVAGELAEIPRQVSTNATSVAQSTDGETNEALAWTGSNSASTNNTFTIKSGGLLHQTKIQNTSNSDIITGIISQPWSLNTPNGTFIETKQHQEGAQHFAELLNVVAEYNTIEDKLKDLKEQIRVHNERVKMARDARENYTLGQYEALKSSRESIVSDKQTAVQRYEQFSKINRYAELDQSLKNALQNTANLPDLEIEPEFNLALLDRAIAEKNRIDDIDVNLTNKTETSVEQYNEAKQAADEAAIRAKDVRSNSDARQGQVDKSAQDLTLANQDLEAAIRNLKEAVNKEALRIAVNESDEIKAKPLFTRSDEPIQANYTQAINDGQEVLSNHAATQAEVSAAVDKINQAKNNLNGLNIEIEEVEIPIPHAVEHRLDYKLAYGQTEEVQAGEDGSEIDTYEYDVDPETGNLINKRLVATRMTKRPKTEIIRVGMKLESKATDTYIETLPYTTQTTEDNTLYVGMRVVDTPGVLGERKTETPLIFKDGKLVKDTDNQTVTTTNPVAEVVRVGTKPLPDFEKMQSDIKALQSGLEEANNKITGLDGRVATNEGEIGTIKSNITDLQGKIAEQEKQLSELQTETGRLDEAIKATDGKVDELAKTVNDKEQALQESINGLRNELDAEKGKLNDAINRIGKNERDIKSLQDRASDLETRATNLEDRANNLDTKVQNLDNELKQEVAGRQQAINDVKQEIQTIKENLERTIGENKQALDGKLTELEGKLSGETSKLDELTKRVETNKKSIENINSSIETIENEANILKGRVDEFEAKINTVDKDIKDEVAERAKAVEELHKKINTAKQELQNTSVDNKKELESTLNSLREELNTEKDKLENLDKRVTSNEANIAGLKGRVSNLESRARDLEKQANSFDAGIDMLGEEVKEEIENRKKAINGLYTELNNMKLQIVNNKGDIEVLENELAELESQLGDEASKLEDLTERVSKNEENITSIKQNIEKVEQEANELTDRVDALEDKSSKLDDSIKKEIADRKEAIDAVKTQLDTVKDEVAKNAKANKEALENQLNNLSDKLKGETAKLEALDKRVTSNEASIAGLRGQIDNVNRQANDLEKKANALQANIEMLDEEVKEALQAEIDQRQQEIKEVKQQIEAAKQELQNEATANKEALENQLNNLSDKLKGETAKLEDLDKRVTSNEASIAGLKGKVDNLNRQVNDLEKQSNNLQASIDMLDESTKEALQAEIDERQKAITRLQNEIDAVEEALENADEQTNERIDELSKQLADEADKLNNLDKRVTSNEANIAGLKGKVDNLNRQVNDLEKQSNNLQASIDMLDESTKEALQAEIDKRQKAITRLQNEIDAVEEALENADEQTNERIDELGKQLANEADKLNNLDKRVTSNEANIAGLKGKVDNLNRQV